ncbi:3-phosphoglycerate dehydrogenase family protein [Leuconostoc pseudomesenteroides]|uniref:3-phosphoglycerate dehydrogenase family protein n=1 Tax=Leuconostoc pseudomesenteroides TaxID=33968 RepID=UPI0039EB6AA9
MTNIKTYNAISGKGLDYLSQHGYDINAQESPKGILLRSQNLFDEVIPDTVRAVVRSGAGFNNIPVADLSKRGIVVFNTPGGNANAVKELTIASLILAARPVVGAIRFANQTRGGDVSLRTESNKGGYRGTELAGKTLGVIGLGNVGSKVANTALALDMDVIGYDPGLNATTAWRIDRHIVHARNVEEVLRRADYVTVHIPMEEKNQHFIDASKLQLMKPEAALLNLSRGGIVDDHAAKTALDSDQLRMYITDFADDVLFDNPKVIITPHIGGSTIEAEDTSALMAAKELDEYLTSGNIINSVNYPDVNEPFTTNYRVGIIHENVPNMIGQISAFFGDNGINIEQLSNRAVGQYAYTLVAINDFTSAQQEHVKTALDEIPHVILTRRYQNPNMMIND